MIEQLPDYWEQLRLFRKLLIAESWQIHILMATFLLGSASIGPLTELFGQIFKQPFYDKFAKGIALVNILFYSVGAVLAIGAVFVTLGFYPKFFTLLFLQFYWFLIGEEITFFGQLYIVVVYYYTWDKLSGRAKPLHILLGFTWLFMAILQQSQIISFMGYALTPYPPTPFFNPGFIPQVAHRAPGNVSWAGFAIAAFAGIQYLRYGRLRDRRQMAFWDWVGSMGLILGVLFMAFFMMFSGYAWAIGTKGVSPSAFYNMMVGPLAWMFQLQVFLLGFALAVSGFYMWQRLRMAGRSVRWVRSFTFAIVLFWLLGSIPYYIGPGASQMWVPWTIPLGAMRPWKYVALAGVSLFGLAALLAYLQQARHGLNWGQAGLVGPRALITAGILALSLMVVMGAIRETSRLPGQIYGEMGYDSEVIPKEIVPFEDVHRPKLGPFRGP